MWIKEEVVCQRCAGTHTQTSGKAGECQLAVACFSSTSWRPVLGITSGLRQHGIPAVMCLRLPHETHTRTRRCCLASAAERGSRGFWLCLRLCECDCVCVCAYVCICVGVGGRERVRGCSKGEVLHSLIQKRWHLSFPLLWGNVERFPVCVLWHMILWPRCLYGVVFMSMNSSVLLQITPIGFKIYSVVLAVGSTGNFAPSMWSDKWHVGSRVFLVKRVPRLKQACTEVMYNDAAAHTWQCTIDRACEIWKWNADNWTGGQLDEKCV